MPRQKKTSVAPDQDAAPVLPKRRTIDLLPVDVNRISALKRYYLKDTRIGDMADLDVMRLALEDACIHNGLEQPRASTVEPIGGE